MSVDQYFTPARIAAAMVSPFRSREESLVADFAAGNGDLLMAARTRWPGCGILATDLDDSRVRMLRQSQPDWLVGKCDFLRQVSRRKSAILRQAEGKVSLVLLNPPFSCRGNERVRAMLEEQEILCSRAMAFVIDSIPYLSPAGRLAAVLPAGCPTSQKDARAWELLREAFNVKQIASHGLRTFDGCAARTVLVCLSRSRSGGNSERAPPSTTSFRCRCECDSGVLPVHEAMNGMAGPGWPFVHTTNLQESAVAQLAHSVRCLRRYATGPCVLIPRVGQPDNRKCVLYLARKRMVLSDCVFAIKCGSVEHAKVVHSTLLKSWCKVQESYRGTCARYITMDGLLGLLRSLGIDAIDGSGATR